MELDASFVVLGDHQFYKGYTLLLSKTHVSELHLLPFEDRSDFLREMAVVGEAVFRTVQPQKLNYEILGNETPHLHCHIFPRHLDDQHPTQSVWTTKMEIRNSIKYALSDPDLEQLRQELKLNIKKLLVRKKT